MPRDTIFTTDVGAIKSITSQAWTTYEPATFFESNGLSAMSYSLPAAMAARLAHPDRPVLCTIGDGGFGMTCAEIETCVRERLHFMTVVFNDSSLSLIHVAPAESRPCSIRRGSWRSRLRGRRGGIRRLDPARAHGGRAGVRRAGGAHGGRPVVIDVLVDPAEYRAQNSAFTRAKAAGSRPRVS